MEDGALAGQELPKFLVWLSKACEANKKAISTHTGLTLAEIPARMYETLSGLTMGAFFLDEYLTDRTNGWWLSGGSEAFFE